MADTKPSREHAIEFHGVITKAANYLLVANGAGLVGTLSVIKDYATTPQLKGMGIFIALFGIGLIAAIISYISGAYLQVITIRPATISKSLHRAIKFGGNLQLVAGITAVLALVAAIVIIIFRFSCL